MSMIYKIAIEARAIYCIKTFFCRIISGNITLLSFCTSCTRCLCPSPVVFSAISSTSPSPGFPPLRGFLSHDHNPSGAFCLVMTMKKPTHSSCSVARFTARFCNCTPSIAPHRAAQTCTLSNCALFFGPTSIAPHRTA
jgi:hypothetical protein